MSGLFLARLKGKEVVRVLESFGFRFVRSRGSHVFLRHPDGGTTVMPFQARKQPPRRGTPGRGTVGRRVSQASLSHHPRSSCLRLSLLRFAKKSCFSHITGLEY
ncbi:MAG: hypothetical protein DMG71_06955 [Acidobacteria bacterium]|nr:MAG: hypothetical protein DMG71_06955 [Acidobacteriota bacterium]